MLQVPEIDIQEQVIPQLLDYFKTEDNLAARQRKLESIFNEMKATGSIDDFVVKYNTADNGFMFGDVSLKRPGWALPKYVFSVNMSITAEELKW